MSVDSPKSPSEPPPGTVDYVLAEQPGSRIGPYRLMEQIGEGGFGLVFVAEQQEPVRRKVALKLIKPGMDSRQVIARFEAERQALALMDHPNIAKILDAGVTESPPPQPSPIQGEGEKGSLPPRGGGLGWGGGRPYFVMELVRGIPITEYCDQHQLAPRERLELFITVCQAIQHAHQKGIIHRDIKPSNVLVTSHDGKPVAKVIDFGVAKAISQQLTERTIYTNFAQMVGTPLYMSPEQAEMSGLDIDTRSDIYSLGVLLYELLTGTTPFDKKRLREAAFDEIRRMIREDEPPKPSTRISQATASLVSVASHRKSDPAKLSKIVRGDLDWITMKALEKDRTRRYETANGLGRDVQRYLNDEPVEASPPKLTYQLQKFIRRNKGPVVAIGLVGGALLLGAIISTIGFAAASRNARLAAAATNKAEEQAARATAEAERANTETLRARTAQEQAEFESYFANLSAAYVGLNANEVTGVAERLNACPERLRNWEWRYLNARVDESLVVLGPHTGPLINAIFSPSGDRAITSVSGSYSAHLWDTATGKELTVFPGGKDGVWASFSPSGDRALVGDGNYVRIWDTLTFKERVTLRGHQAPVIDAKFNLTGDRVVTASVDKTARVWEAATGRELAVLRGHEAMVYSAAFNPAADRVVTGARDSTARLWDAASGQQLHVLRRELAQNDGPTVRFSESGDKVLFLGLRAALQVADAKTGKEIRTVPDKTFGLQNLQVSPSGDRLLTCANDGSVRLIDVASDRELAVLRGHKMWPTEARFNLAADRIVTTSRDKSIRLWDAATGNELANLRGHGDYANIARFSRSGDRIITAGQDKTARIWDAASPSDVSTLRVPGGAVNLGGNDMEFAAWSPNGDRLVTSSADEGVRVWDASTGRMLLVIDTPANASSRAAFDPSGERIVILTDLAVVRPKQDVRARVMDARTGRELLSLQGHEKPIASVAFSPTGDRIVTASRDGTGRVWDAATGRELAVFRGQDVRAGLVSAAFSPNGDRVVTTGGDKTARVWDAATGREIAVMRGHDMGVMQAVFNPKGDRIATAGTDHTARVWDAGTGKELMVLRGHNDPVRSVAFSPSGDRIATASNDRTIRIWDAGTGREVAVLRGHEKIIHSVAFSPAGDRIVSASQDGTARIWHTTRYRERFPAIAAGRDADRAMRVPTLARLRGGESSEAVIQSLVGDRSLSEGLRRAGLAAVAEERSLQVLARAKVAEEAKQLISATWQVVNRAGGSPEANAKALAEARRACELAPNDVWCLTTLSFALYRADKFEEALATVKKSDDLSGSHVTRAIDTNNWAVRAMAQFKLGRIDEAKQSLARAHEILRTPNDFLYGGVPDLSEADALINGKGKP